MLCSKCSTELPEGSQFCLKCGQPVGAPAKQAVASLPRPRSRRFFLVWFLVAILLAGILWVVTSESPAAQAIQELVGWKHDRSIIDTSFSVGPHSFRYYKFSLSEGSTNVAVVGHFTSAAEISSTKDREKDVDNNIEVFVLSESAFIVWQNGYAASNVYESGKVAEGAVQADLPGGPGIYYLIFSNKSSPKTPRTVHATVLLHYKNWSSDWLRRVKSWFGFGEET